jgi:hypothetical protein
MRPETRAAEASGFDSPRVAVGMWGADHAAPLPRHFFKTSIKPFYVRYLLAKDTEDMEDLVRFGAEPIVTICFVASEVLGFTLIHHATSPFVV